MSEQSDFSAPEPPEAEEPPARGLIAWFAHNHVAANILMLLFLVGGLISVFSMRTETFPSIDPRLVTVSVVYPGASPYEVADSITSRVEESVLGIEGVKRISASASEGYGIILVELEDFADADDVYNDVETAVNGISDFPPEDAERPIIKKLKVTPNVMSLAIHGDASEAVIKYWAETIEDEIRQLDGVALTEVRGIRNYEISIEIPESALRRYNLRLQDIQNAVAQFSIDVPSGTLESRQGDILLRIQEKSYTGEAFKKIAVRTLPDGSSLTIGDIGRVIDGFEDKNLVSKFNGERAAFIDVSRSETEDTLSIVKIIKDYLETVQLPNGLSLSIQKDATVALRDRISLMMRNGILGFMLVFLILLLFLDLKLAFWTSAAIPVSFLGGLMMIHFLGYSMNMITLFALIVVLGIVVDDAIVTGESIFDEQQHGKKDGNSAIRGVMAVIAPVTVGVTTTIAAFAPLIFSTGTLGQIIMIIPIVVISILSISLIEAYFILPAHLSNPSRWSKGIVADIRRSVDRALYRFVDNRLIPLARFSINWRYATLTLFIGFAIITASLFTSGILRFVFFPNVEGDEVTIGVTLPEGTPFEVTEQTMLKIEEQVLEVQAELEKDGGKAFESVSVGIGQNVGTVGPFSVGSNTTANDLGQVQIQLVPSDFRNSSSFEIERMIRERIEGFPNIDTLSFQSSPIGEEADVEVELTHPDEEQLNTAAEELKNILAGIAGTKEVTDSFEEGKEEFVFKLNDVGLSLGLTPSELGRQLRSAFFGLEAQRLQRGRSEIIVYVRYPEHERENLAALSRTRIRLEDGREVPLNAVTDIQKQRGYSTIETVNGRRIVTVSGDVDPAVTTPTAVIEELTKTVLPQLKHDYPGLTYSFEGESREQAEDLASLGRNMLIALMLIYVLLGAQLRSYIQPLIIMSAIPFGVVGATWGHLLFGYNLTFISMFGIVALTGVVINDSVVLMDYLNTHREKGKGSFEAALVAIARRFRPILLTTLTTALGLLPMLLETSLQARFLIPMVISLATGIVFATFIILFLIPCLVVITEDIKNLFVRVSRKATPDKTFPE